MCLRACAYDAHAILKILFKVVKFIFAFLVLSKQFPMRRRSLDANDMLSVLFKMFDIRLM